MITFQKHRQHFGAMEAETIKNAVIPKNHKSRGNLLNKSFLIIVLISFSIGAKSQIDDASGGISITFGSPILQKIEQCGIDYKSGFSPDIDISGVGFFDLNTFSRWGWGASMSILVLDISEIPDKVKNKNRRGMCGFYTGPFLLIPFLKSGVIFNAQIGYTFTNLSPILSEMSWGGFSTKVGLDFVIRNYFSIGAVCRPISLLINDEYVKNSYNNRMVTYTLKPAYFNIRLGFFFGIRN